MSTRTLSVLAAVTGALLGGISSCCEDAPDLLHITGYEVISAELPSVGENGERLFRDNTVVRVTEGEVVLETTGESGNLLVRYDVVEKSILD